MSGYFQATIILLAAIVMHAKALTYLAGTLTWDAFNDNRTFVIVKTRLVWSIERTDDANVLCSGNPKRAQISLLPITVTSLSLGNETHFDCAVRNDQLHAEAHFIRNFAGNQSYQERININGTQKSGRLGTQELEWRLSTLISFKEKNDDGSTASPPHAFASSVTTLNPKCNQTTKIGAVNANRFGYIRCFWPTAVECGDPCNKTVAQPLFNLKEDCMLSVEDGSVTDGHYLVGIKVLLYDTQLSNFSMRETFLHFTVDVSHSPPCSPKGLEWDSYGYFEDSTFYHDITGKYCQTPALEVPYIGLIARNVDARLTYYGPVDGDFFYNRTENGNTYMHKLWWTPTVEDLGTNVVCLNAASKTSTDTLSISTCFYLKIYINTPNLPVDMCGTKPGCISDSVCLDPSLLTPSTSTTTTTTTSTSTTATTTTLTTTTTMMTVTASTSPLLNTNKRTTIANLSTTLTPIIKFGNLENPVNQQRNTQMTKNSDNLGVQVGVPIAVLICLAAFIVAGVLITRHRARKLRQTSPSPDEEDEEEDMEMNESVQPPRATKWHDFRSSAMTEGGQLPPLKSNLPSLKVANDLSITNIN